MKRIVALITPPCPEFLGLLWNYTSNTAGSESLFDLYDSLNQNQTVRHRALNEEEKEIAADPEQLSNHPVIINKIMESLDTEVTRLMQQYTLNDRGELNIVLHSLTDKPIMNVTQKVWLEFDKEYVIKELNKMFANENLSEAVYEWYDCRFSNMDKGPEDLTYLVDLSKPLRTVMNGLITSIVTYEGTDNVQPV
jgi:hypothetical protein